MIPTGGSLSEFGCTAALLHDDQMSCQSDHLGIACLRWADS